MNKDVEKHKNGIDIKVAPIPPRMENAYRVRNERDITRATLRPFIRQRSDSIPRLPVVLVDPLTLCANDTPLTAASLSAAHRRRNCFYNINTSDNLARLCFPCGYAVHANPAYSFPL
jgi:hypothetical protein